MKAITDLTDRRENDTVISARRSLKVTGIKKVLTRATLLLAIVSSASMVSANLLLDGSFELPETPLHATFFAGDTLGDWNVVAHSDGHSWYSDLVNNDWTSGSPFWPTTPAGLQYVYLADAEQENGISQSVYLTAGSYELSYIQADFKNNGGIVDGELRADVEMAGSSVIGGWKTSTVPNSSDWVRKQLTFNLSNSGSYDVRFESVLNHAGFIDDVQLNAVPEPSAFLALGLGLPFLLLGRRKKD